MLPPLLIGQILAIIAALTYAENSIIYSYLGKEVSTRATVHVRLWIAVPVIVLMALIGEGNFLFQASLSNWIILLISGVLGYFFCDSFSFWAFTNIGPREAMVIMTLNPIFNSVLSYFFFREILTIIQMFSILITLSGIIILILNQEKEIDVIKKKNKTKGAIFALLAAIFQASSNILAKTALTDLGPISTNAIRMIGGLIAAAIFALFFRKEFKKDFTSFKDKKHFSLLLIATISGPVIGMSLLLTSFNYAPVGLVTALVQISPIFILIYELIFIKKHVKLLEIGGTIISVIGVAMMFL
ncbi:MAG: DMT family transporter [Sphaerochaetaceae bacterium]|nr:DMT family transporter [Sphaerochaetaceae bacterium]MDC7251027.1 DMT family transporter [Sphaerochaetaceae bacterium]